MSTLRVNSNRSALAKRAEPVTNFSTGTTAVLDRYGSSESEADKLFVGFDFDFSSVSAADRVKSIEYARVCAYLTSVPGYGAIILARGVGGAWDESTLTFHNAPSALGYGFTGQRKTSAGLWASDYYDDAEHIKTLVGANGLALLNNDQGEPVIATSRHATQAPYIEFGLGDDSPSRSIVSASPSGGYKPKNAAVAVSWSSALDGVCIDPVTIVSTKIRYRASSSVTATEVNCSGKQYGTIPASAMTGNSIQWQCETVDSLGNTATSPWYTLSTVEAQSTAVAVSPRDVMLDASSDNLFVWEHKISTGTAPTRSVLKYTTDDGSPWMTFLDVSGLATQGVVPAGTLPSGTLRWIVCTYNTEGTQGLWSNQPTILVVGAPAAPVVSVTQTPRPTVSWQGSDQQGYRVRVGDYDSGSVYGAATSMQLPVILPDGDYIAEVRVVNEYGLWSDWGSAPLTVANTPGAAISLTATAAGDIVLSWTTAGSYERYLVERDGEPIAITAERSYTDQRAVGEHSYRVLGIQAGSDDYGVSDPVTVTLTVETNSITDLDTGDTLPLRYSTAQIQEEQIERSRELTLTHLGASAWPTAELGKSLDKSIALEAAFSSLADARRLEAMVGHLVCVKCKNDEIVVGVLPGYSKISSAFWVDYNIEIRQTDDEEAVEL